MPQGPSLRLSSAVWPWTRSVDQNPDELRMSADPGNQTTNQSILHTTFATSHPHITTSFARSNYRGKSGQRELSCYPTKSWPMPKLSASLAAYLSWIVQQPFVSGGAPSCSPPLTTMTCWFGLDRSCQSGDLLLLRCGEGHTVHTAGLCRVLRAHTLANPAKARQPLPLVS